MGESGVLELKRPQIGKKHPAPSAHSQPAAAFSTQLQAGWRAFRGAAGLGEEGRSRRWRSALTPLLLLLPLQRLTGPGPASQPMNASWGGSWNQLLRLLRVVGSAVQARTESGLPRWSERVPQPSRTPQTPGHHAGYRTAPHRCARGKAELQPHASPRSPLAPAAAFAAPMGTRRL